MKKKQTESTIILIFFFCVSLAFLGYGCGGGGGLGGKITHTDNLDVPLSLSGKAYFQERQIYGNIPIVVKNIQNEIVKMTYTDSNGNYAFYDLAPGVYSVAATTGESEVTFANSIQITEEKGAEISPTSLLCVKNARIDRISSYSFHIDFTSNQMCTSSIKYKAVGGIEITRAVTNIAKKSHETTISGLNFSTTYELTINLVGNDGQVFELNGLTAQTIGQSGSSNLAFNINNGDYETINQTVTLYLNADDCKHMRMSEDISMEDALWVQYSPTYTYNFSNNSPGIKRIYVQFQSKDGVLSPILTDSIIYTTSGYLGVWINNGEAITNQSTVQVKAIYPGATHMLLSDNQDFANAFWENYIAIRNWKFNSVEGVKHIYCKFKGGTANPDDVYSSSIVFDNTPPKVEFYINDGARAVATSAVKLQFTYANTPPAYMKITNTTAPTSADEWIEFKTSVDWKLPDGDGAKTVYALFRDSAGNTYGPVSAGITIDSIAPAGNTVVILENDSSASPEVTSVLMENLPCFLHFKIADTSTTKMFYYVDVATTTSPPIEAYQQLYYPANPIELSDQQLTIGKNRVWAYFEDDAGNKSATTFAEITLEGAEIVLNPKNIGMTAGQIQNFTFSFNNTDETFVGQLNWELLTDPKDADNITEPGYITSEGVYTAPDIIWKGKNIGVKATSINHDQISGIATISLEAIPQIVYMLEDGSYSLEPSVLQIAPTEQATFTIYIIGSIYGIKEESISTKYGIAKITSEKKGKEEGADYGFLTTLCYTAPSSTDYIEDTINFTIAGTMPLKGSIKLIVFNGAKVTISKSSESVIRGSSIRVKADVENTKETTIHWSIPTNEASFSENELQQTRTSPIGEWVTIYASDYVKNIKEDLKVYASIDGVDRYTEIDVYPPIELSIDPVATFSMPLVEAMIFTAYFDSKIPEGIDDTINWYFRNSTDPNPEFKEANGRTYADKGSLTVLSNTQVQYKRPIDLPKTNEESPYSNEVIIKAVSALDEKASATAKVTLGEKVIVKIYNNVEKQDKQEIKTAGTVIEVGSLQFYVKVTPEDLPNTSVTWTVNGVTESESFGRIDANGKYTAPSTYETSNVVVRATSNYDPSVSAEVNVTLSEFWAPKRENMIDSNTHEYMPISKLFVDPTTSVGNRFKVYAATGAENKYGSYGLWVSTFSDEKGSIDGGDWVGVGGLSSDYKSTDPELLIYDIAMSTDKEIFVSTGNGFYYIPNYDEVNAPVAQIVDDSKVTGFMPASPITCIDTTVDKGSTVIIGGCNEGVYTFKLEKEENLITIATVSYLINTVSPYRIDEARELSKQSTTNPDVYETITYYAHSYNEYDNPINAGVRSIRYDNLNKSLYFGTSSGNVYYCPSLKQNMKYHENQPVFRGSSGSETVNLNFYAYNGSTSYPSAGSISGVPLAIALDVINTNTLWCATTRGVSRSIDYGSNWTSYSFGDVDTNARCVLVDPNNTINVMAGSEDGLYRTTDGGQNWTRIRSGLGNYKTITSLAQAPGAADERRKVWVGTSGGVFIGRQSLQLE